MAKQESIIIFDTAVSRIAGCLKRVVDNRENHRGTLSRSRTKPISERAAWGYSILGLARASVLVGLPIWKGSGEDNQKNAGRRVVQNVRSGRSRHQVEVSAVEANGPALGEGGGNQILDLLDVVAGCMIRIYMTW